MALRPDGAGAQSLDDVGRVVDEAAIRQLSVRYALGTDAIGAGDLDLGLRYYRRTFTHDAAVSAGFDRSAPALSTVGWESWAGIVRDAFVPYSATQHLLGTIDVEVGPEVGPDQRRKGRMSTYLQATHVLADTPELLEVLGTYLDEVVLTDFGWRIARRFLQFTSFETVPRTLP